MAPADSIRIESVLAVLGLDIDADERAVRSAYARRLKTIDPGQDPAGFQTLREAYEIARAWAVGRARLEQPVGADGTPPSAPQPLVPEESAPVPETSAPVPGEFAPVPGEFAPAHADVAASAGPADAATSPPPAADPATPDVAPPDESRKRAQQAIDVLSDRLQRWVAPTAVEVGELIDTTLDDPAFVDLDARLYYEWAIAGMLAGGWQPGHEHLWEAALARFGWRVDRGRILAFGQIGFVIDRAIGEFEVHEGAPAGRIRTERRLLRRLRSDERPDVAGLLRGLPRLERLCAMYPHLAGILTNVENLERWRRWNAEVPGWKRWLLGKVMPAAERDPSERSRTRDRTSSRSRIHWLIAVLVVLPMLKLCASSEPFRPPAGSARLNSAPVGTAPRFSDIGAGTSPRYLKFPSPAYPPEARRHQQEGTVRLRVMVNEQGRAEHIEIHRGSGHPLLDAAAVEAMREARFIPGTDRAGAPTNMWVDTSLVFRLEN